MIEFVPKYCKKLIKSLRYVFFYYSEINLRNKLLIILLQINNCSNIKVMFTTAFKYLTRFIFHNWEKTLNAKVRLYQHY